MISLRALFLLLASSLLLAACATRPVVQLYPGAERPGSQVLTVRIPSPLEVFTINGKKVDSVGSFFSAGYTDVKLAPGRYEIIAYYEELWNLGADEHTTVKSDPVTFVVDGKGGERYRLDYTHPDNADQARALAEQFSGWTENMATGQKTPTQDSGLVLQRGILAQLTGTQIVSASRNSVAPETQPTVAPQDTPTKATATTVAPQAAAPAHSYLDTLKAQWNQATAEERRAFLQWIAKPGR